MTSLEKAHRASLGNFLGEIGFKDTQDAKKIENPSNERYHLEQSKTTITYYLSKKTILIQGPQEYQHHYAAIFANITSQCASNQTCPSIQKHDLHPTNPKKRTPAEENLSTLNVLVKAKKEIGDCIMHMELSLKHACDASTQTDPTCNNL